MEPTTHSWGGHGDGDHEAGATRDRAPGKRALTDHLEAREAAAELDEIGAVPAAGAVEAASALDADQDGDDAFGLHLTGGGGGGEGAPRPRPDNPLRGLIGGDGIVNADRAPRVRLLQDKLAARVGPPPANKPWKPGKFDLATLLRLHAFQDSLEKPRKNWISDDEADALWSGAPAPKPPPQPKPQPQPKPSPGANQRTVPHKIVYQTTTPGEIRPDGVIVPPVISYRVGETKQVPIGDDLKAHFEINNGIGIEGSLFVLGQPPPEHKAELGPVLNLGGGFKWKGLHLGGGWWGLQGAELGVNMLGGGGKLSAQLKLNLFERDLIPNSVRMVVQGAFQNGTLVGWQPGLGGVVVFEKHLTEKCAFKPSIGGLLTFLPGNRFLVTGEVAFECHY